MFNKPVVIPAHLAPADDRPAEAAAPKPTTDYIIRIRSHRPVVDIVGALGHYGDVVSFKTHEPVAAPPPPPAPEAKAELVQLQAQQSTAPVVETEGPPITVTKPKRATAVMPPGWREKVVNGVKDHANRYRDDVRTAISMVRNQHPAASMEELARRMNEAGLVKPRGRTVEWTANNIAPHVLAAAH